MGRWTLILLTAILFICYTEQASASSGPPGQSQPPNNGGDSKERDDHDSHDKDNKKKTGHDGKFDESELKNPDEDECDHDDEDDKGIKKCNRGHRKLFICIGLVVIVLVIATTVGVCIYKCKQRRKQVSDSTTNLQQTKKTNTRAQNYIVDTRDTYSTKPPLEGPIVVPSSPPPPEYVEKY